MGMGNPKLDMEEYATKKVEEVKVEETAGEDIAAEETAAVDAE